MKILFVCRGNVGRSQMAEALMIKMSDGKYNVQSAGIKLSGPEQPIGELAPAINDVLEVMNEEGIDVSQKIRNQVTEEMVEDAHKIILVVDDSDPIPEYLENNPKVTRWNVLDPKGQTLEFNRKVKDQIKEKVKNLIEELEFNEPGKSAAVAEGADFKIN